jgi:lysyl-tRNA synthetase class 2
MNTTIPTLQNLKKRACALATLRDFFNSSGYLEIETRAMRATTATDPYIESFQTTWCADNKPYFLQTSPEFPHKILLSRIRHPIFEVARVFRNEMHGALHRREFTLVEWYKPDADYRDMMAETESLVRAVSRELGTNQWVSNAREKSSAVQISDKPFRRLTVAEAFEEYAGFSPIGLTHNELVKCARKAGSRVGDDWSWNDIMNCVLVDFVEPNLGMAEPTYLIDYPASMASLAQVRHEPGGDVAERFELYICGIELCNGYSELNDAQELRRRFEDDNAERIRLGLAPLPIDEDLLAALPSLGKLGGNALGFERLLMLCLGCDDIAQVMIDL